MTKLDALLAKLTTSPQEPQQEADPHNSPQAQPEAEITPKRARRPAINPQPTPGREARQHAEAWLQAIRGWHTRGGGFLVDGSGPRRASSSRMQVVGSGSIGGPPVAALHFRQVSTPISWLSESAVGAAISHSGQPCLLRLQKGGGPASLIDPRGGWRSEREASLSCAAALLELAVELGDPAAQGHLEVVRRAMVANPELIK